MMALRTCRECALQFEYTTREAEFLQKLIPNGLPSSASFSPPTLCGSCRLQRRLIFRNERNMYYRNEGGKQTISLYHPKALWGGPYSVLPEDVYRSDALDPYIYGREFDFNRPFFEQFAELHKAVPRMSMVNIENENSPYTTHTGYSRNCYMLPCSENCENCLFGRFLQDCRDCVDCTSLYKCELCYEGLALKNCYHCFFTSLSENCSDCYFCEGMVGCTNCLFCTNLQRQEYCVYNEPVGKEAFSIALEKILGSRSAMDKARIEWHRIRQARIHRPANILFSEDCSGDFISHSRGCNDCYEITECEDCMHVVVGFDLKDCQHCSNLYIDAHLSYEIVAAATTYHCAFASYIFRSRDVFYSEYVYDSHDIFGSIGIKRGEYTVLNRRYEKEQYLELISKIVAHMKETGEWGEMFPGSLSPFGYDESVAFDYFPLSEAEARKHGWHWRGEGESRTLSEVITDVPDDIADVSDTVLKGILICSQSGKPFRILSQELAFYRKQKLPLPARAPHQRHFDREALKNPRRFSALKCPKCGITFKTNVESNTSIKVFCSDCFQKEVF